MKITEVRIQDINPYKNNPRNNEEAVGKVMESIRAYGFKVPIVLDKNNVIVCGHTRYKAAISLGLETVPCIIADDLTPKQVKAFRIADNKTSDFSLWDNRLLLEELEGLDDVFTGFEIGDLGGCVLDEKDDAVVKENKYGLQYEIVFRSDSLEKIDRIKEVWEAIDGENSDS